MNEYSGEHVLPDAVHNAADTPDESFSPPTGFADIDDSDPAGDVAGSGPVAVEEYDQPIWETAPATDINAALAYAQHLINDPYDHPALQSLAGLNETVDQIAGPQAVAGVLGVEAAPGATLDDLMWQQLGLTGYQDLQGFIDAQYSYVDQIAAQFDPGLSGPAPGYESFFGPLGLQTASGVELPTLGSNSWFGASHSLETVLGPMYGQVFTNGVINPQV